MALPRDFLDELHIRNDIVETVGSFISLKRKGRLYGALCPFHNEKTPSFTVYPDTQSYYCFGCGAGGDIISFVMRHENLEYIEAVRLLAQRANMTVPDDGSLDEFNLRKRIIEANKIAARFFYEELNTEAGGKARAYLRRRRLEDATIRRFGLGYAPSEWSKLRDYMRKKGFRDEELAQAGLCSESQKGNGVYDFFRDRLMFPVIDVRGDVVAFSGRTLGDDARKYLNTRDTPAFKKSRVLYALNIAKKNPDRRIIVAEGQMDVIAIHQAGFSNAVAALGTAMTAEHARLISQYADEVVLAYDVDIAGQKATARATEVLKSTNVNVRVLKIDEDGAKDPDEYIKKFGAGRFAALLSGSSTFIEFELYKAKTKYDIATDSGRVSYLKDAAEILARCDSATERDIYAGRVSTETGILKDSLLEQARRMAKRSFTVKQKQDSQKLARSVAARLDDKTITPDKLGAAFAQRRLIALIAANPDMCAGINERVIRADFSNPDAGAIYEKLSDMIAAGNYTGFAGAAGILQPSELSLFSGILAESNGINFVDGDADFLIDKIIDSRNNPGTEIVKSMNAEQLKSLLGNRKDKNPKE
ncbi:MAG: DNA primase [Oscillospiraceae bacterium]